MALGVWDTQAMVLYTATFVLDRLRVFFLWLPVSSTTRYGTIKTSKDSISQGIEIGDVHVEGVTENLASQLENNTCIDIQGLYKEFKTNTGVKTAVNGLNLTMFSGINFHFS
jgi:hypothetical protein